LAIERKRVYLLGHSNGGYMSYRMACQFPDVIASIASLAGTTTLGETNCRPSKPVNVLHIHGTADGIVPYSGGRVSTSVPGVTTNTPPGTGAMQVVQLWAGFNGSQDPVTDADQSQELTTDVPGLDTTITRYTNSPPGGTVELWTINGGSHTPTLSSQFSAQVIDWLLAHPKP
jgi:polyhydroxybutyrate depolymerase